MSLQNNAGGAAQEHTNNRWRLAYIAIIYIYLSIDPPVLLSFVVAFCFPGTCVHCYACENELRIRFLD